MVLSWVLGGFLLGRSDNANTGKVLQLLVEAQMSAACGVWVISKNLPDCWLTASRTLWIAVIINGGPIVFALLRL